MPTPSPLHRRLLPALLLAVLPLQPAPAAAASDWPMFRGPNGQGTLSAADLPTRFDPAVNLAWKATVPPAHSSPVLLGSRIFLTGVDGEELVTIALDRASGRQLWRRTAPRPRLETLDHRNGPAAASPAADADVVVVFFGDYGLLAYDHDGAELWKLPLGPFDNLYGTGASPLLVDGRVVLAIDQQNDSFILAVDAPTGRELWRTPRPEAKSGHSTPIVHRSGDAGPQILMAGSFLLTGYDLATGEKLWWVGGLPFEMKSTPSVDGDLLFIHGYGSPLNEKGQQVEIPSWQEALADDADGDGMLSAEETSVAPAADWLDFVDLDRDGLLDAADWEYLRAAMASTNAMLAIRLPEPRARGDLTEEHVVWRHYRRVPQLPSPLSHDDVLWMINDRGITTVFDPPTGQVLAQGRIEGLVDSIYASPVAADGKVFIAGRSGKVAVLSSAAAREGRLEVLAVNDLDELILATPALDERTIYVRTETSLQAFRVPADGTDSTEDGGPPAG